MMMIYISSSSSNTLLMLVMAFVLKVLRRVEVNVSERSRFVDGGGVAAC